MGAIFLPFQNSVLLWTELDSSEKVRKSLKYPGHIKTTRRKGRRGLFSELFNFSTSGATAEKTACLFFSGFFNIYVLTWPMKIPNLKTTQGLHISWAETARFVSFKLGAHKGTNEQ